MMSEVSRVCERAYGAC